MRFNLTLTQSLLLLVIALVVATQVGSYFSTSTLIESMVSSKEMEKAAVVSAQVESMIKDNAVRLQSYTRLLASNPDLAMAAERGTTDLPIVAGRAFREGQLSSLEITDLREIGRAHV